MYLKDDRDFCPAEIGLKLRWIQLLFNWHRHLGIIKALTSPQPDFSFFKRILTNSGDTNIKHRGKPFTALLGHYNIHILSDVQLFCFGHGEGPPGLHLVCWISLKCAQLGCSWEHLAAVCPQHGPAAAPCVARMEGLMMQQSMGGQSRIHRHSHTKYWARWDCSGSDALGQLRFLLHAAPAPGEAASPWSMDASLLLGDCLGFPSIPEGAVASSTLSSWLLYAWPYRDRATGSSLLIYVEFAVSCCVHGDLPFWN